MGRDFVVDYQGDSTPEAVTEEAPAKDSGEVMFGFRFFGSWAVCVGMNALSSVWLGLY